MSANLSALNSPRCEMRYRRRYQSGVFPETSLACSRGALMAERTASGSEQGLHSTRDGPLRALYELFPKNPAVRSSGH